MRSGVFRISVKRGDGVECGGGAAGHLPRKNISFYPQNDKFRRILREFLTGRKHGSLGTRILQFNREITKLTKTVKIIQKFTVRPGGAVASSPPPPNTPLIMR